MLAAFSQDQHPVRSTNHRGPPFPAQIQSPQNRLTWCEYINYNCKISPTQQLSSTRVEVLKSTRKTGIYAIKFGIPPSPPDQTAKPLSNKGLFCFSLLKKLPFLSLIPFYKIYKRSTKTVREHVASLWFFGVCLLIISQVHSPGTFNGKKPNS